MFQIQPFLSCLGISPYFKEPTLKSIVNSMLFIDFVHILKLDIRVHYFYNLSRMKNMPPILQDYPNPESIKQLFMKYFKSNSKCLEDFERISLKNWNEEKLLILIWIVSAYETLMNRLSNDFNEFDWQTIANLFPNISTQSLQFKWLSLFRQIDKRIYEWTEEEDLLLLGIISECLGNQLKWSEIAQNLSLKCHNLRKIKTGKECRERFLNHLDPALKRNHWNVQEDMLLLEMTLNFSRKWAKVSRFFPGRTQHNIKNRFISLMVKHLKVSRKKLAEMAKEHNLDEEINSCLAKLKCKNQKIIKNDKDLSNEKKNKRKISEDDENSSSESSKSKNSVEFDHVQLEFFNY